MNMNKILFLFLGSMSFIFLSCEPEMTFPSSPNVSDFSIPSLQGVYPGPVIKLCLIDKPGNTVYLGEQFEIRMAVYNMPDSLFAAILDSMQIPSNIEVEQIIQNTSEDNTNIFKPVDSTIVLSYIDKQHQFLHYGICYKGITHLSKGNKGVVCKLICRAVSPGVTVLRFVSSGIANGFYTIDASSSPYKSKRYSKVETTFSPMRFTVSDAFWGGRD
jgi:hypothetical protein